MTIATPTLRPRDPAECAVVLANAGRDGSSVRVRGGGTKAYLGETGPTDLVLDTTALAGVVDHVPADLTVTVAGGTRLAAVREALAREGQMLPLDPPHVDGATVGGIVATRSDGFSRLRYGGVRHLLIGAHLALSDGTIVHAGGRVVKNVAGYDLDKVIVGSFGTLGVIVQATFKVAPLPAARALAVVTCSRAADAFAVADALLRTPLRPSALAVEGTGGRWRAFVAVDGGPDLIERALADVARSAAAVSARSDRHDDPEVLLAPLRELPATATDGALLRAALPLAAQTSFAESAARLEAFARAVADAGNGIVRVHLRGDTAGVIGAADTLLAAAAAVGGSARVERREPALTERLRAWGGGRPSGDFLMRRLKAAFDPAGILEPGRSAVG